ncbi:CLIP domain-containing serine protease HP8 [Anthophora retusa]
MIRFFILAILQTATFSSVAGQFQGQSNCATPNNVAGSCVGIRQCPQLLNLLEAQPLKPEVIDFLRKSQCGFEGNYPRVCCPLRNGIIDIPPRGDQVYPSDNTGTNQNFGQQNTETNTDDANLQYDLSNNPLLPTNCGKDLSQRIFGGERTDLDEFPWMALLEYSKPNGRTTACGGVLISRRYVVTAAHCVRGSDIPKTWRLDSVRLGEYNTDTNPDCIQDDVDSVVCADNPITVGIEEQIAHENYRPKLTDRKYDIALLRLSRDITFTNYIQPICLPPTATLGQRLFVAGWGKTENRTSSNVKLKVSLPIVDKQECQTVYGSVGMTLGYGQICAGGQKGMDSCRGDSGGPLMGVERTRDGNGRWTVVGVVSLGPANCGMAGWPGVYTRVIDFVPWIVSKMRA